MDPFLERLFATVDPDAPMTGTEWMARKQERDALVRSGYWPIDFDYESARRQSEWSALPQKDKANGEAVMRSKPR